VKLPLVIAIGFLASSSVDIRRSVRSEWIKHFRIPLIIKRG
jgi:hypothetical protein